MVQIQRAKFKNDITKANLVLRDVVMKVDA